ncbi:MAG: hypothetical protein AAFZ92_09220 [Pseudomonadota bacterium]
MLELLLFGLPSSTLGGLALTVVLFLVSAVMALVLGYVYAVVIIQYTQLKTVLLTAAAMIRGIPLLLLVFMSSYLPNVSTLWSGILGLTLYSFSHVGEIQRGYLTKYPHYLTSQTRAMGIGWLRDWGHLRPLWIWNRSFQALLTHWISLLKDTGALVVLGIGELTTVAKVLSESSHDTGRWLSVLMLTALLYLVATLGLIGILNVFSRGASRPVLN